MKNSPKGEIPWDLYFDFYQVDAIAGSVESKIYDTWYASGQFSSGTATKVHKTLPSGATSSNIKKVDFYFNDAPYITDSSYGTVLVSSQETITLTPGTRLSMLSETGYNEWILFFTSSCDIYMHLYHSGSARYSAVWNIALTFYI